MKTLDKIKDLLVSSEQIHLSGIGQFQRLDINKLKKELRLDERAKENGSKQLPSSGSEDFDDVESEIINTIEAERGICLNEFSDHLTTYNQRLANLNIEARLTQVTLAAKEAIGDFKAQIHQGQDDLEIARDDVDKHANQLKNFKLEHGLTRPAHYPRSKVFHLGVIAIIFVAECLFNALFLAVGNEFGLLGGVGEAFVISLVNIGIALFLGRKAVPFIFHKHFGLKLFWGAIILIFCLGNFGFNLLVAHYRDALAIEMSDKAAITAMSSFMASPFNITDFKSWIMVGVGCFFALIALFDGLGMDDPYPKYGHWDRLRRRAYETYADKKASLLEDLKDTRDGASIGLAQLKEDLIKRRQEHDSIIANRTNLLINFDTHQNYLESCGRELITFYRARNRESRNTKPPKHFDHAWRLERKHSPVLPPLSLSDERLNEVMIEASTTIQAAISDVMDEFDRAINKIEQISTILYQKETNHVETQ
ncbi:hypothetical protein [Methylomonas fluvii]|uniref:Transmembrane protein n=1 Tax=Methylomonas fluvii TaxID=1854564 RepID=A0ABR9DFB2_9GAMM|nr:hypothetical protein [Methylomonas fluvii]MBD9361768.1 hypothetical protein [Methylomonas fluvii]